MAGSSAYRDEDDPGGITDINITPFVDVVLVLLVVFIVTAKLIVARGVDIDKPKAEVIIDVAVMQVSRDRIRTLGVNPPTSASVVMVPTGPRVAQRRAPLASRCARAAVGA